MAWGTSEHCGQPHPLATCSQIVKACHRKSTATLGKRLTIGKGERRGEKREKGEKERKGAIRDVARGHPCRVRYQGCYMGARARMRRKYSELQDTPGGHYSQYREVFLFLSKSKHPVAAVRH